VFFERENNVVKGVSDKNGLFTAEKESTWRCEWVVQKDGYYDTTGLHSWTQGLSNDSVKNGRWQPWNPTVEVVLKEKRNPITLRRNMRFMRDIILPVKNQPVGFDFLLDDWIAPFGKGKIADLIFTYSFHFPENSEDEYVSRLVIETATMDDGLVLLEKNKWSGFPSVYEAPHEGYEPKITLITRRLNKNTLEKVELTEDQYLVFRSRTVKNLQGHVIQSNFGKIYGRLIYGGSAKNKEGGEIRLNYYFNPNNNDPNLESEGGEP
jgi:hypothetical protein